LTGIAVKPEAGKPPTLDRARYELADVKAGRKAGGEGEQFAFQYNNWKMRGALENAITCIEKFRIC
jgi:hypothetical protein